MSHSFDRRHLLTHGGCLLTGAVLGGWLSSSVKTGWPSAILAAADEDTPEKRLKKLGLELPKLTPSRATLVPTIRTGNLLFVSGHGPSPVDGKPVVGKLGKDFTVEQGQQAARNTALVVLAVVRQQLGSLDRVVQLVKTLGMVNCTADFTQQPQVVNGFSNLMVEVFGDRAGKGTRSAVGMASLPMGWPIEVECLFEVRD